MGKLIAIDEEMVGDLQATLEATRLEMKKLQQQSKGYEPLSAKEAAAYLKISRQTLASYTEADEIVVSRFGNRVWYKRSALDAFLTKHERKRAGSR